MLLLILLQSLLVSFSLTDQSITCYQGFNKAGDSVKVNSNDVKSSEMQYAVESCVMCSAMCRPSPT